MDFQDGTLIVEQLFYRPDGSTGRTRHESVESGALDESRSFEWEEGRWVPRRQYLWKKAG